MSGQGETVLDLQECLSIQESAAVFKSFKEILKSADHIKVSGVNVSRIDGAGCQLLYLIYKDAEKNGVVLDFSDISEVLKSSLSCLGLKKIFSL
ncbi:MAG: hypothetical protein Q9O24_01500 [Gammaproteobacteria bacterium]|nr:hypothetical protein [Gammaproteobacteria bacterium]